MTTLPKLDRPGWVRRDILLVRPSASVVNKQLLDESGFAVRVIAGAQYILRVDMLGERGEPVHVPFEGDELCDGWTKIAPAGFSGLEITPIPLIVEGAANPVNRIVLEVLKVPAVAYVDDDMRKTWGAVKLLRVNQGTVAGEDVVGIGVSLVLHNEPAGAYQKLRTPGSLYQSRYFGNQEHAWFPTPSLYFHGFVAADADTFELWIYSYVINGNGAAEAVFYRRITVPGAGSAPAGGPNGTTFTHVIHLKESSGVPMEYPANGCIIYVKNTSAVASITTRYLLATRSA